MSTIEDVPAGLISWDLSYQRDPAERKAWLRERIANRLKPDSLGIIALSRRVDGSYWSMDGTGRVYAVKVLRNDPKFLFKAQVFHGWTVQQEAAHALSVNEHRKQNPLDKFRLRISANDPLYVQLWLELQRWKLKLTRQDIPSVGVFEQLFCAREHLLAEVLDFTAPWRIQPNVRISGSIYAGVGLLIKAANDHGLTIDRLRFCDTITSVIHPGRLLKMAQNDMPMHPGHVAPYVAATTSEIYNRRLHPKNRLPTKALRNCHQMTFTAALRYRWDQPGSDSKSSFTIEGDYPLAAKPSEK